MWVLGGVLLFFVIWRVGVAMLRGITTPQPAPPPAGELRRDNLRYRCSICGTEMRMTLANDELADPPKHCQEEMDLVAPAFE